MNVSVIDSDSMPIDDVFIGCVMSKTLCEPQKVLIWNCISSFRCLFPICLRGSTKSKSSRSELGKQAEEAIVDHDSWMNELFNQLKFQIEGDKTKKPNKLFMIINAKNYFLAASCWKLCQSESYYSVCEFCFLYLFK